MICRDDHDSNKVKNIRIELVMIVKIPKNRFFSKRSYFEVSKGSNHNNTYKIRNSICNI